MLMVKFFAILRESLECDQIVLEDVPETVAQLRIRLSARGEKWQDALASYGKLVAVNQSVVDEQHKLSENDEVAFFPPVTGG
ncbi:MAG: MoaD/ThiS family protein [Aestuariibacter sp.]